MIVVIGLYGPQLLNWLRYWKASQMLVINYDDLFATSTNTISDSGTSGSSSTSSSKGISSSGSASTTTGTSTTGVDVEKSVHNMLIGFMRHFGHTHETSLNGKYMDVYK